MANIQIPNLPAVASLSGAELFEGVQAGTSVKISLDQVIAASRSGTPTTLPLAVSVGGTGADNPADARTNLGLGTISTQNSNSVTITGGSITGITDLAVTDGGTGASNATDARTNLGLGTISTQNSDSVTITGGSITGITDLAVADGGTGVSTLTGYVKGNGTSPFTASATVPSTDITGLGTMSVQNANNVTITGGSITGITDLAVTDGGTGVSTLTGYVKGSGTSPLTASATIPNTDITGLGTMSVQDATSVTISGGSINGTSIGASSASTIKATTGNFSGDLTLESAQPRIAFAETDTTDTDARVRLNGGDLIFDTITDGGVIVQENMRITSVGMVGIGTTGPTTLLDVAGTANATNMTRNGSQVYSRDNILATVSQTAGVPTGGIIERGTNANGEYVKYADGTMICWLYAGTAQSTATASGSIFLAAAAATWTFPVAFSVAPVASGQAESTAVRWILLGAPTTTTVSYRQASSVTSATAIGDRLFAIGRWF